MSPKHSSARRCLFPSSDDAVTPSSPSPALMTLHQSQSASNSTDLLPPPGLKNKSSAQEMDEGKSSQQPCARDPAPGMAKSSFANDGVQEEEKEKATANDGLQEEEKSSANEDAQEEASTNEGVQEDALKTDLSASCPESNPPARKKKKPHLAIAKGKKSAVRVWSIEDEVRILECLAAHVKAHGAPPARAQLLDVVPEHNLDKKEFTLVEIYEKVRRMKDRYYSMRCTADAGAPPRGDADDLHKYELSGKIWGDSQPLPKREIKENGSGQAPETCVRREFEELRHMYPDLAFLVAQIAVHDRGCLKRAFGFIDDNKARELDAKVKKQRVLEVKTWLDRTTAQSEVLRTLLEYMA